MIISQSEHDNFYQWWQRLECVHRSGTFTAIKIIKCLLPWVTFITLVLLSQITPGKKS